MSEYHIAFEEDAYASGAHNSADQGGTYHPGAIFVMDLTNADPDDAFTVVAKLQIKPDPTGTAYADYTATPTLFTVTASDAGDVDTFVVAPSASADVDAFMPRYWRVVATVTSTGDANEIQTLALASWGANDTIKLTFNTHETTAVTNTGSQASIAAAFQAALIALADFAPGDVVVTSGVDVDHFVFTFGGAFANQNVSPLTATSGTGGATGVFVESTPGHQDPTFALTAQMLNL